jgi:hypothetical protein
VDELYVIARRLLLDALDALGEHKGATILVGAQAIYLHTGDADLGVAEYTTDADLTFDPDLLAEIPPLEQALEGAGFYGSSSAIVIWKQDQRAPRLGAGERQGRARRAPHPAGNLEGRPRTPPHVDPGR